MTAAAWYFAPTTEIRIVALRDGERYGLLCAHCGSGFFVGWPHGVRVGPDGALSTTTSFTCPTCQRWHARLQGGVVHVL